MEDNGVSHAKLLVAWHHKVYQNICWRMRQVSTKQGASTTTSRKTNAEFSARMTLDAYFGGLHGKTPRSTRLQCNTGGMQPNVQNGSYNSDDQSDVGTRISHAIQGQRMEATWITRVDHIGPRTAVCCTNDQGTEHNARNTI